MAWDRMPGKPGEWCWSRACPDRADRMRMHELLDPAVPFAAGEEEELERLKATLVRVMWLMVPSPVHPSGGHLFRIFVDHAPNNWAEHGEEKGWDGDEEEPTLHPSIDDSPHWHGWMRKGNLVNA